MSAGKRDAAARLLGAACVLLLVPDLAPAEVTAAQKAAATWIARQVRPGKGLALDIGCGDAGLAIELARRTALKIQCVDPDAATVEAARKAIDAAGLYGTRVAADRGDLARLDYPDYCATLIVCGDEFVAGKRGREFKEILRVLHPKGVAVIGQSAAAAKQAEAPLTKVLLEGWLKAAGIVGYEVVQADGVWARITRPRGEGWDEWTHRAHDPACTHASEDMMGGPELKLLWSAAPQPGLASATVLVAGGRRLHRHAAVGEAGPEGPWHRPPAAELQPDRAVQRRRRHGRAAVRAGRQALPRPQRRRRQAGGRLADSA